MSFEDAFEAVLETMTQAASSVEPFQTKVTELEQALQANHNHPHLSALHLQTHRVEVQGHRAHKAFLDAMFNLYQYFPNPFIKIWMETAWDNSSKLFLEAQFKFFMLGRLVCEKAQAHRPPTQAAPFEEKKEKDKEDKKTESNSNSLQDHPFHPIFGDYNRPANGINPSAAHNNSTTPSLK